MIKVAITGSNGFLAQSLISALKSTDFEVLLINRETPESSMESYLTTCDYCFHFAGEVRPSASYDEFYSSNVEYTRKVLSYIGDRRKHVKFIYASSIHADNPSNDYGKTKLDGEKLVSDFFSKYSQPIIVRLPHLFGVGAKPNHNSVLATWVYNSLITKELDVFDDQYEMHYINSQELADNFLEYILNDKFHLPEAYNVTLGDLKARILRLTLEQKFVEDKFDRLLLKVIDAQRRVL